MGISLSTKTIELASVSVLSKSLNVTITRLNKPVKRIINGIPISKVEEIWSETRQILKNLQKETFLWLTGKHFAHWGRMRTWLF